MKIAVLSGKGGTGKTTVSTNLHYVIENSIIADLDIEEPNAHIFLKPEEKEEKKVFTKYPEVNPEKCILCGKCGEFCRYNAIIPAKNTVLVFKESCHDCGGCEIVCESKAISYKEREIGKIYTGKDEKNKKVIYGELNIGELSGVKIIKEVKKMLEKERLVILDSPPGTACSAAAAVEDVDFAVLVSEPTPFGVSDMKMVVEMLREMNIKFVVVVNKAGLGDNEIYEYCKKEEIEIIAEIPFEKEIAEKYSKGDIIAKEEKYAKIFKKIEEGIFGYERKIH